MDVCLPAVLGLLSLSCAQGTVHSHHNYGAFTRLFYRYITSEKSTTARMIRYVSEALCGVDRAPACAARIS